ncbi:hypothetical protein BKA69DRAFT_248217 [Paraphysoderma sedebokerense]|nr:hypothetical protein BKA69DRAFT_248217 [Paraphysoderma sedebokerense]
MSEAKPTSDKPAEQSPEESTKKDELLAQILSEGYDFSMAELAIELTGGNSLDECLAFLTQQQMMLAEREERKMFEQQQPEQQQQVQGGRQSNQGLTATGQRDGTSGKRHLSPDSASAPTPLKGILKRSGSSLNNSSATSAATWIKQMAQNASNTIQRNIKELLHHVDEPPSPSKEEEAFETNRIQRLFPKGQNLYDSIEQLDVSSEPKLLSPGDKNTNKEGSNVSLNASLSKRVRFSFPETPAGTTQSDSETVTTPSGSLPHRLYISSEVLSIYLATVEKRHTQPNHTLLSILQNAVNMGVPVTSIQIRNEQIPLPGLLSMVEILGLEFGLVELVLENVGMGNEVLRSLLSQLWHVNSIKKLNVGYNKKIKGNGINYLAAFVRKSASLTHLDLSGLYLADGTSVHLIGNALTEGPDGLGATLKTLVLDNCGLKNDGLNALAPYVRNSNLHTLSLRSNKIDPIGAASFGKILRTKATDAEDGFASAGVPVQSPSETDSWVEQEELDAAKSEAKSPKEDGEGTKKLVDDIYKRDVVTGERQRGLVVVDLTGNELKHGAIFIGQAIAQCNHLKRLYLAHNAIPGEALVGLSEGLKQNESLEILDLCYNPLFSSASEESLQVLKSALSSHTSLRVLNLSATSLSTPSLIAVSESLPLSQSLQKLILRENQVNLAGLMALNAGVKMNQTLTEVGLGEGGRLNGWIVLNGNQDEEREEVERLVVEIISVCERNRQLKKTSSESDMLSPNPTNQTRIQTLLAETESKLSLFEQVLTSVSAEGDDKSKTTTQDKEQVELLKDLFKSLTLSQSALLGYVGLELNLDEGGDATNVLSMLFVSF